MYRLPVAIVEKPERLSGLRVFESLETEQGVEWRVNHDEFASLDTSGCEYAQTLVPGIANIVCCWYRIHCRLSEQIMLFGEY